MFKIRALYNILGNRISNGMQKALIRNNFPPQIAERMCAAIGSKEKAKLFRRLLMERNDWILYQQILQAAVMEF